MTNTGYSIDTNTILTAWNETYRPTSFGSFWTKLGELIAAGRAFASDQVLIELSRKDDVAHVWAKSQAGFSVPLEEEQTLIAKKLVNTQPALAKQRLGRLRADGFVIALAKWKGLVVVTAENRRGPEKIPNICDAAGVTCIALADMIESEGWKF